MITSHGSISPAANDAGSSSKHKEMPMKAMGFCQSAAHSDFAGKACSLRLQRVIALLLFAAFAFAWLAAGNLAHAANSLGLGNAEQAIRPEGFFGPVLMWIQARQSEFYKALTDALKAIRNDGSGGWLLVGLSFAYGVFHAAGPGHGKAVISSYVVANEIQLRRGILLSFASAMLQAVTAILIMSAVAIFLRGMGLRSGTIAHWAEVTGYAGITLLGAWLLWRKLRPRAHAHSAHAISHDHGHVHHHVDGHSHHHHQHDDHGSHHHEHDRLGAGGSCSCGHSHMPEPEVLGAERFSLREAAGAVFSVGLRPCSGALVVLAFAFVNGMYIAGILSTFAMAVGTGITVSTLAAMAVGAKQLALRYSGASQASAGVLRIVEISGAALVFVLGATLLAASIY
jgi:ABC-type nickel/cobalt efflux system permease component RcnA